MTATLPLNGLRVIDFSRLLPGPYATLVLADMGADVLKVEAPRGGDYLRAFPPVLDGRKYGARFGALNTGKRSIAVDLKKPQGVEIARELACGADVVVESFRPGVMERLGLGYEVLRAVNPGLIYCAISGYGQDGPYTHRAGHDLNYVAMAGVMGMAGPNDGPPELPAVQVADIGAGALWPLIGILSALHARHSTGQGALIDASMTDGSLGFLQMELAELLATGNHPNRGEAMLTGGQACYGVFETADGGYMTVAALEPKFWGAFCRAVQRPELMSRHLGTPEKARATKALLAELFKTRTRAQWEATFAEVEACVEPVLSPSELPEHPLHVARGNFINDDGGMPRIRTPMRPRDAAPPKRAPELGESSRQVLLELGYDEETIETLYQSRIVVG